MNHNDRAASPNRRDGGYALVFVLVVMVVLCLVASSIMAVSLRNLQNQKAAIERMQDEYTAQGAIEQVVSQLCATESFSGNSLGEAIQTEIDALCRGVYGEEDHPGAVSRSTETWDGQTVYPFELKSVYGSCTIVCKLELKGTFTADAASGWTATNLSVTYLSYEVGQTAESREEGGE